MNELVAIVVAGAGVIWAARRLRQSEAVWLIIAGMLLGPPALGVVRPDGLVEGLAQLGVALIVGAAGLRLSLGELVRAGRPGAMLAAAGALASFAGGFAVAWAWSQDVEEATYVGISFRDRAFRDRPTAPPG